MNDPKEYNKHKLSRCVACGHDGSLYPLDIDYTKTRGSGGSDHADNCCTLCRKCYTIRGSCGIAGLVRISPNYEEWLIAHGWKRDPWNRWRGPITASRDSRGRRAGLPSKRDRRAAPKKKNTKASCLIPEEVAEFIQGLGGGNFSKGVRILAHGEMERLKLTNGPEFG